MINFLLYPIPGLGPFAGLQVYKHNHNPTFPQMLWFITEEFKDSFKALMTVTCDSK